jgi:hypothetical protein
MHRVQGLRLLKRSGRLRLNWLNRLSGSIGRLEASCRRCRGAVGEAGCKDSDYMTGTAARLGPQWLYHCRAICTNSPSTDSAPHHHNSGHCQTHLLHQEGSGHVT